MRVRNKPSDSYYVTARYLLGVLGGEIDNMLLLGNIEARKREGGFIYYIMLQKLELLNISSIIIGEDNNIT